MQEREKGVGPNPRFFVPGSDASIFCAYAALSVMMTWPLARGLMRDVPGDLGDSLLNMWILGWGAEQVPRLLTGQIDVREYWNANIFHPEPLALAFSEHLFGQVLQILPIYALTGNLILCYNLLFLSSFALSGFGAYLLTRDLLGHRGFSWPAFVGGVFFAFVPLRVAQVAHIQSLSAQWMPLAILGFRRFLAAPPHAHTRRATALAGGCAALLMQNWSCGYYLIFFAPFVLGIVLQQMIVFDRARDWRTWAALASGGAMVAAGTWPFLSLYLEARQAHAFERSLAEVVRFSADVYSYLTAPTALTVWGSRLQAYPKPEGELFLGFVAMMLAAIAVAATARDAARHAMSIPPPPWIARLIARLAAIAMLVQALTLLTILATGGWVVQPAGITIRATDPVRMLIGLAVTTAVWLAASKRARAAVMLWLKHPAGLACVCTLAAAWLSLGPAPQSHGRPLDGFGLYGLLYDQVPGFDGLRVPARYSMLAALFLTPLVALGTHAALTRWRSTKVPVAIVIAILIESAALPLAINLRWSDEPGAPTGTVLPAAEAPAVYHWLATRNDVTAVAEFPFGDPAWELRYVYYATVHWQPLLNGYSGGFPRGYSTRVARLQRIAEAPDEAWRALVDAGTSHVVFHRAAYADANAADDVAQWLEARGARVVATFDQDVIYHLPSR